MEKEFDKREILPQKATSKYDQSLYLLTTTLEGAMISLDIMIFWKIKDSDLAAKNAMDILNSREDVSSQNR